MNKKYREGDWFVYCDICGQRCYASEATKLSTYTGRGDLLVCRKDADRVDYGLVPYSPRIEQNIPYTRINHTNTDDAAPLVDLETMTLCYELTSSQDNIKLTTSQGDQIIVCEPI